MAKPEHFTVHLIRVGETSWDADKRVIGATDLPMTQDGQQAILAATMNFHPSLAPTKLLTSEEESSIWVANQLKSSADLKHKALDSLSNVSMGLWEGELESGLSDRCPTAFKQWKEHPARITPPEGESFHDARDRLIGALQKQLVKYKGDQPQVILVLRSWAWAIVRCSLSGTSLNDIWEQLEQPIEIETFQVTKQQLDECQSHTKAGV